MRIINLIKFILICTTFYLTCLPQKTLADEIMESIHAVCIPELRLFYVEPLRFDYYWPVPVADKISGIRTLLEKENLLLLSGDFTKSCQLGDDVYRVEGYQPPARAKGRCGGAPRIVVSLFKNEKPIIEEAYFSPDCHHVKESIYLRSINIQEAEKSSYYLAKFSIYDKPVTLGLNRLSGHTLNRKVLQCLAEKSNSASFSPQQLNECLEQ